MKKILLLAITLFSLSSFAQESDSANIEVVYTKKQTDPNIAFFVNGRLIMNIDLSTSSPQWIKSLDVVKKDTLLNGHTYDARILITTKDDYAPSFISLNELKRKYTNLEDGPTLFMMDDRTFTSNYDEQLVDEKAILRIVVDKISNSQEKLDINVVKLITKSEENIKKSKRIMIRGNGGVVPAADYMDNVRENVKVDRRAL